MNSADSIIGDAIWITTSELHGHDPISVKWAEKKRKVPSISFVADTVDYRVDARVEHTQHDSKIMHWRVKLSYVVFKQQII